MQLFYIENILGEEFLLGREESNHIIKVLRKKIHDYIFFTDGKGYMYKCEILEEDAKKCRVRIVEKQKKNKKEYNLHIAMALTKSNDRYDFFLEKATELGIDEITPIVCHNSERVSTKEDRLEKVIISGIKQSLNFYKPKLNPLVKFENFIKDSFDGYQKMIPHCYFSDRKSDIREVVYPLRDYLVMIGPEGDFTKDEIGMALEKGFVEISLGERRLRTETAGIYVASILNFVNK